MKCDQLRLKEKLTSGWLCDGSVLFLEIYYQNKICFSSRFVRLSTRARALAAIIVRR
jgi:hypothetical protein